MKTIKIDFIGFWEGFDKEHNMFTSVLEKKYKIEISNTPDYIFCSMFGDPYEYCNYDAVRIFYSGENYSPDFNIFDYAMGFDFITYEDRYFRYPISMNNGSMPAAEKKHLDIADDIISSKPYFCNYIYGNSHAQKERTEIFELLSTYKRVESKGTYLNNDKNNEVISSWEDKIAFQSKCKFSIAFESVSQRGFVTEKLIHAFAAKTVPIYFGDPLIGQQFNEKAFINCRNYKNFNEVLEYIKYLDENDEEYLKVLREPVWDIGTYNKEHEKLESFIYNIFDQPLEAAYRRPLKFRPYKHDQNLKKFNKLSKNRLLFKIVNKFFLK